MNKRVLVISPHFPPVNAADMHRVRLSLPYFKNFGWDAEVVIVDDNYVDLAKDAMLLESIPQDIKIHRVRAFSKRITSKFGLGSLALRSMYFYRRYVNYLLKKEKFDLIYFSTTEFPLCILGSYWKKRFNILFVIDMQDPWHSEYYEDKPKSQRPPKYWFSYNLHKYLEPIAMTNVDGIISVSENYIDTLERRYPHIKHIPTATITFPASDIDLKIAEKHSQQFETKLLQEGFINLVYIGRGGYDMQSAVKFLFEVFRDNLKEKDFAKMRFCFIGTSYASAGNGIKTILPVATTMGVQEHVIEETDRISYYETLAYLKKATGLIVLGSDDPSYTASKVFNYILAKKPLLAIFNIKSSAAKIILETEAGIVADITNEQNARNSINNFLGQFVGQNGNEHSTKIELLARYEAKNLTKKQVDIFDKIMANANL